MITTKELIERTGVKRGSLNHLAPRLGLTPVEELGKFGKILKWPESAVEKVKGALDLRARMRRERTRAKKAKAA